MRLNWLKHFLKHLKRASPADGHWFSGPEISLKHALVIAAVVTAGLIGVSFHSLGETLENRFQRPFEFRVRHWLHRDPHLDARVRLYGLGDTTLSYLKAEDLSLEEWAKLLKALQATKPRAVFIDKVFGIPSHLEQAPAFVKTLQSLDFPVIAGAFVSPSLIPERPLLDGHLADYQLARRVRKNESDGNDEALDALDWLPIRGGYPYGPSPEVREGFHHIGHLMYDGNSVVQTFVRLSRESALPLAPLFVAKDFHFTGRGDFIVDETRVPLDAHGRLLPDFLYPTFLQDRTFTLTGLVKKMRENTPIEFPPDTVVVLLPMMYTGHTDRHVTPFGFTHGGYLMTSLINSVLTGQWLSMMPHGWIAIALFGALGLGAGLVLQSAGFWVGLVGVGGGVVGMGLWLFIQFRVETPWLLCATNFFLTGFVLFAERTRAAERKMRRLKETLEGSFPPDRLQAIVSRKSNFTLEPTGKVVTVMFIDIVGFSLVADRQTPRQAFLDLKELIGILTEHVHGHGGIVDRTIGDGMLCFFGYNYDGGESVPEHADNAVACAIAIQKQSLERTLAMAKNQAPVYPMRIGIHTASVYIGDLGSSSKIDLTLIGHGVNFAKRLESACESYRIMLGTATREMLLRQDADALHLKKRFISVKHVSELVEAYEYDPFFDKPGAREEALAAYRKFAWIDRKEQRFPIPKKRTIEVVTNHGTGTLVDFSESGFSVKLDRYLGCGVTVSLTLQADKGDLKKRLKGIFPLIAEVRWGTSLHEDWYLMGLLVKNVSAEQKELLFKELCNVLSVRPEPIKKAA